MYSLHCFFDIFQASYYNGDPNDRHTMNTYSGGQYGNDRLTIVEMRANRYYSPSKNYVSIRTSTEHPRVCLIMDAYLFLKRRFKVYFSYL